MATQKIKDAKKRQHAQASKRHKKRKKKRIQKIILMISGAILLAFLGCYFYMRSYIGRLDPSLIHNQVYVGEQDLSGMTAKEAQAALEKHFAEDIVQTVSMQAGTKKVEMTLEELSISPKDVSGMVKKAVSYGREEGVWSNYRKIKKLDKEPYVIEEQFQVNEEEATLVLKDRVAELEDGAVDASITKTSSGLTITEGKDGKVVNIEASLKRILVHLNGGWDHKPFTVEMVLETGAPKITAEDLAEVKDVLGEFSTDAGGGERWQNLKAGVDLLNGKILMPGEALSVYNTTAPYDEEHGYVKAGTYENGEIVADWGGGICQVSTTLYNAIIYAELEIVERYPHSMTVSYVDPSRDAAIAGGYLDLVFKNPYDTPIYIYGEIDAANQLRFIIYGKETRPANRTIEFESETVSVEEYKVKYKENPELSAGKMEYTGNPHAGKDTQLWKIVYEDGKEVSREVFNYSYYERVDQVVEVGTAGASDKKRSALQSAIASQDYDRIMEAISSEESQD